MIGANTTVLMGLGLPGEVADLIGADYSLTVGSGTAQVGAKVILGDNAELNVSAGQTAVLLPANQQVAEAIFAVNTSGTATTALIFVPPGHKLNGTTNASFSLAQFKSAVLWQYKFQNWTALLTA